MQTNFTFIKKEDHLFMNLTGKYNLQDYFSIIEFAKKTCDAENINKILANTLDVELTDISTMDRFDLGKKIAETLQYKIKIAFIAKKEIVDGFAELSN
ncbi:MAG: hypothetical protein WCL70_01880 [Paludibacter sp.]